MSERLSGYTLLVALLAKPIRHSLSPKMHNAAYAKLGLDYAYLAFEVDQAGLKEAVEGMRAMGIRGANISMPNKQAILPYLDALSPEAQLIGAVNTVVNQDGKGYLVGHCTDGIGAIRSLLAEGVPIENQVITMAGAGGAGTAIAVQLALDGAREVRIFNCKDGYDERARELAGRLTEETQCQVSVHDLADKELLHHSIAESSLFINATGVGMAPLEGQSVLDDPTVIHSDLVVFDVIYHPAETALLRLARKHGAKKVINGLGMMIHQGAAAFQLHTGKEMPLEFVSALLQETEEGEKEGV